MAFTALALLLLAAGPVPGEAVYNIEPGPGHPRNSEGAFVTLRDGRILFYYTEFTGGSADDSAAHIVGIESKDNGTTWSASREIVSNEGGANVMSVSLLRLASGKLALFYLRKNNPNDCQAYLRTSTDEAATWSAASRCTLAPGYFVLNNDRVIQLESGRLVMPVAYHRTRGVDLSREANCDMRAIAVWYLSDDEGSTWHEADNWWALPVRSNTGLQEPGVVQLPDHSLLTLARTDTGHFWEMRSTDRGQSWTAPTESQLATPASPVTFKMIPNTNHLLALYNDHSGRYPFPKGRRTPFVAAISDDGGRTWSHQRLLEDDPHGWYCYSAMHFVGGSVLMAYGAADTTKMNGLARIRIRRLPISYFVED